MLLLAVAAYRVALGVGCAAGAGARLSVALSMVSLTCNARFTISIFILDSNCCRMLSSRSYSRMFAALW